MSLAALQLQAVAKREQQRRYGGQTTYDRFKETYYSEPADFALSCIDWPAGEGPTDYQLECLDNLVAYEREAVRGPHGLGKTTTAALAVLWFALTRDDQPYRDWKCITTASAWRQLSKFLWPEIHKWARRIVWSEIGRPPFTANELLTQTLSLNTGSAFPVASDDHTTIEGAHANDLFYLYDEAKAIPLETYDATEGAFMNAGPDTGDEAYALAISTPGEPSGRFYDIHSRKPGYEDWHTRHVTLAEAIAAGRISADRAEQRRRQWGEQSAIYQNRVLGEFAASEEDTVIPLSWVERAVERWHALGDISLTHINQVGADIARGGEDKTVFALRTGLTIAELREYSYADTMQTAGRLASLFNGHQIDMAFIDLIGIGAGVFDRLREQGYPVYGFNASERTDRTDKSGELGFVNKRSAAWWNLREMLEPTSGQPVALPPNDLLLGDLVAPTWTITSGGRIKVESKDKIKRRLGRSTDYGDAVIEAYWDDLPEQTFLIQAGAKGWGY